MSPFSFLLLCSVYAAKMAAEETEPSSNSETKKRQTKITRCSSDTKSTSYTNYFQNTGLHLVWMISNKKVSHPLPHSRPPNHCRCSEIILKGESGSGGGGGVVIMSDLFQED